MMSKRKTMKIVGGSYDSVQEMVNDSGDPEYAEHFREYQADRLLVKAIRVTRGVLGITDDEFAERIQWNTDDVADFDAMPDGDISLRDLASVAKALKLTVAHRFEPEDDSPESIAAFEAIQKAMGADQ